MPVSISLDSSSSFAFKVLKGLSSCHDGDLLGLFNSRRSRFGSHFVGLCGHRHRHTSVHVGVVSATCQRHRMEISVVPLLVWTSCVNSAASTVLVPRHLPREKLQTPKFPPKFPLHSVAVIQYAVMLPAYEDSSQSPYVWSKHVCYTFTTDKYKMWPAVGIYKYVMANYIACPRLLDYRFTTELPLSHVPRLRRHQSWNSPLLDRAGRWSVSYSASEVVSWRQIGFQNSNVTRVRRHQRFHMW